MINSSKSIVIEENFGPKEKKEKEKMPALHKENNVIMTASKASYGLQMEDFGKAQIAKKSHAPKSNQMKAYFCPVNSSLYLSVPGLCGGPDVPHVALECRKNLAEGNDVGVFKAPPVSANNVQKDVNNSAQKKCLQAVSNLTFKFSPVVGIEVAWDTALVNDVLYVELPSGILPEGSKQSLVTLLEYAEERLKCSHVVLCFKKDRTDRVSLLRVFNFFGFQVLPPGDDLVRKPGEDLMYMAYTIERDSDDEDSSSEEGETNRPGGESYMSSCDETGSCSDS